MATHLERGFEFPPHLRAGDYPNVRTFHLRPEDLISTPRATLGRAVLVLATIRFFERWLIDHVDLVHGPLHSSIGQEAVAVGMSLALRPTDRITASHRAHHHMLAKQLAYYLGDEFDPFAADDLPERATTAVWRTLSEILGLSGGMGGGRGGSMHLADFEAGVLTTAIVGGGIPIASGEGLAARLRGTSAVAVAAFGDGAASIGAFHEGVSLARAWNLPVIFLLENNLYSVATTVRETTGFDDMAIRAAGYDMPAIVVDGMNPIAVLEAIGEARAHAVADGPVLIEARTYRVYHHSGPLPGSAFRYRSKDEEREWSGRDPLSAFPARLIEAGLATQPEVDHVVGLARRLVEHAAAAVSEEGPEGPRIRPALFPDVATLHDGMIGPGLPELPTALLDGASDEGADEITYGMAISRTIARWVERDPEVFVMGIEVGHMGGGAFGATKAALVGHPERVLSTPICENGFVGAGIGAAVQGMHPIVEIMYPDFALEAADQLFNHAAKLRYMYGGRREVPLLVRVATARRRGYGPQHSCDPAALFALFPGWRIAAPSTASEYIGLFNAAMLSRDPVLIIEDHRLATLTAAMPRAGIDYVIPLRSARRVRNGNDLTVLAWGYALTRLLPIADRLREAGIHADVLTPVGLTSTVSTARQWLTPLPGPARS